MTEGLSPNQIGNFPENKEAEKKGFVFIIYRDNEVYSDNIDSISDAVEQSGNSLETQIFPIGTNTDDIKEWIESHPQYFDGSKVVLTDETCGHFISWENMGRRRQPFESKLDSLYSEAVYQSFSDEEVDENDLYYEKFGGVLKGIATRLVEKTGRPSSVVIFDQNIADHLRIKKEEIPSYLKNSLRQAGIDESLISMDVIDSEVSDELLSLQKNFSENSERIKQIKNQRAAEIVRKIASSGDSPWIIIDRHAISSLIHAAKIEFGENANTDENKKALPKGITMDMTYSVNSLASFFSNQPKLLLIPTESLVQGVVVQGLVDIDYQKIKDTLTNKIISSISLLSPKKEQ